MRQQSCARLHVTLSQKTYNDPKLPVAKFDNTQQGALATVRDTSPAGTAARVTDVLQPVIERLHSAWAMMQSAESVEAYEDACRNELGNQLPLTDTDLPQCMYAYHTECTKQRAQWLAYMFDRDFWQATRSGSLMEDIYMTLDKQMPQTCLLASDALVAMTYTVAAGLVHDDSDKAAVLRRMFVQKQAWRAGSKLGLIGLDEEETMLLDDYANQVDKTFLKNGVLPPITQWDEDVIEFLCQTLITLVRSKWFATAHGQTHAKTLLFPLQNALCYNLEWMFQLLVNDTAENRHRVKRCIDKARAFKGDLLSKSSLSHFVWMNYNVFVEKELDRARSLMWTTAMQVVYLARELVLGYHICLANVVLDAVFCGRSCERFRKQRDVTVGNVYGSSSLAFCIELAMMWNRDCHVDGGQVDQTSMPLHVTDMLTPPRVRFALAPQLTDTNHSTIWCVKAFIHKLASPQTGAAVFRNATYITNPRSLTAMGKGDVAGGVRLHEDRNDAQFLDVLDELERRANEATATIRNIWFVMEIAASGNESMVSSFPDIPPQRRSTDRKMLWYWARPPSVPGQLKYSKLSQTLQNVNTAFDRVLGSTKKFVKNINRGVRDNLVERINSNSVTVEQLRQYRWLVCVCLDPDSTQTTDDVKHLVTALLFVIRNKLPCRWDLTEDAIQINETALSQWEAFVNTHRPWTADGFVPLQYYRHDRLPRHALATRWMRTGLTVEQTWLKWSEPDLRANASDHDFVDYHTKHNLLQETNGTLRGEMSLRHVCLSDILRTPPRNTTKSREMIVQAMHNSVIAAVQLKVRHTAMPHCAWAMVCHVLGNAGGLTDQLTAADVAKLDKSQFEALFGRTTNHRANAQLNAIIDHVAAMAEDVRVLTEQDFHDNFASLSQFRNVCVEYANDTLEHSAALRHLFRKVRMSSAFQHAAHDHIGRALRTLLEPRRSSDYRQYGEQAQEAVTELDALIRQSATLEGLRAQIVAKPAAWVVYSNDEGSLTRVENLQTFFESDDLVSVVACHASSGYATFVPFDAAAADAVEFTASNVLNFLAHKAVTFAEDADEYTDAMQHMLSELFRNEQTVALGPYVRLCTENQLLGVTTVTAGLDNLDDDLIVQQCSPHTLDGQFYIFNRSYVCNTAEKLYVTLTNDAGVLGMNKLRYQRLRGVTSPVGYMDDKHGTSMTAALRASLYASLGSSTNDLFSISVCGRLQDLPTDITPRVPPAHAALPIVNARGDALRESMQRLYDSQRTQLCLSPEQLHRLVEGAVVQPCGVFADEQSVTRSKSTQMRGIYAYGQLHPVSNITTELLIHIDTKVLKTNLKNARSFDTETAWDVIASIAFDNKSQTCTNASLLCCGEKNKRNPYNSTAAVSWPRLLGGTHNPFAVPSYTNDTPTSAVIRQGVNFNNRAHAREAWLPKTAHMFALSATAYCTSQKFIVNEHNICLPCRLDLCTPAVDQGKDNRSAIQLLTTARQHSVYRVALDGTDDVKYYQDAFRPALQTQLCMQYAFHVMGWRNQFDEARVYQRGTMRDHAWDAWLRAYQIASIGVDETLTSVALLSLRTPLFVCAMLKNNEQARNELAGLAPKSVTEAYKTAGKECATEYTGTIQDAMLLENPKYADNKHLVEAGSGKGSMANVITRQQFFEAFTSEAILLYDTYLTHQHLRHASDAHAQAAKFEPLCYWPQPTTLRLPSEQTPLSTEPI